MGCLGMFKRLLNYFARPKRVLFYRDYISPHGGHFKVADYFQHTCTTPGFCADMVFSERTVWNKNNPWFSSMTAVNNYYQPDGYDYVFLAGMDWQVYLASNPRKKRPVINLIQHVRHADPDADVYAFLTQSAIRICVSNAIASAIQATGHVNGPIFTIPNGLALPEIKVSAKVWDIVIVGVKHPGIAKEIYVALQSFGLKVLLIDTWLEREYLYEQMALSKIAVLLPNQQEGFYLPALEAMKYCDLTIVPDCVGNRDFCFDQQNCLMPAYNVEAICEAVKVAIELLGRKEKHAALYACAQKTVTDYSLERERIAFQDILTKVDRLWFFKKQ